MRAFELWSDTRSIDTREKIHQMSTKRLLEEVDLRPVPVTLSICKVWDTFLLGHWSSDNVWKNKNFLERENEDVPAKSLKKFSIVFTKPTDSMMTPYKAILRTISHTQPMTPKARFSHRKKFPWWWSLKKLYRTAGQTFLF